MHATYDLDVVGVGTNQASVGRLLPLVREAEQVRVRRGVAPGNVRRQNLEKIAAPRAQWQRDCLGSKGNGVRVKGISCGKRLACSLLGGVDARPMGKASDMSLGARLNVRQRAN
jgi:hypothetical protein